MSLKVGASIVLFFTLCDHGDRRHDVDVALPESIIVSTE
jgi:hypothetical protein